MNKQNDFDQSVPNVVPYYSKSDYQVVEFLCNEALEQRFFRFIFFNKGDGKTNSYVFFVTGLRRNSYSLSPVQ